MNLVTGRNLETGRKASLSSRSSSTINCQRSRSAIINEQVKDNQLSWMYNRRKSILEKTTK